MGFAAVAGAAVAGGFIAANGAESAAGQQAGAINNSVAEQQHMFDVTQQNLEPYNVAGQNALTQVQNLTGTNPGGNPLTAQLTKPFNPTMADLAATPGYQFTLDQGLKSTQNGYAAKGLGSSGAASKGAADYAEGLAGTTYQNQFQNYWAQNQSIYNELMGLTNTGESAAAGVASAATSTGQNVGNTLVQGGNAAAAGTVGASTAISQGLQGAGNNYLLSSLLNQNTSNGNLGSGLYSNLDNPGSAGVNWNTP